jgi:hypothetical protein
MSKANKDAIRAKKAAIQAQNLAKTIAASRRNPVQWAAPEDFNNILIEGARQDRRRAMMNIGVE